MTDLPPVSPPYRHVVAAVDNTEHARVVAVGARRLADQLGAHLHVFHADLGIAEVDPGVRANIEDLAASVGAQATLAALGAAPGHPDRLIAAAVDALPDAVAVLGSRGRHGLTAVVLGSTTANYLLFAGRPAVVLGREAETETPITRVVCCLDGSRWAEELLGEAAGWARALDVPLWLVQATEAAPALAAGLAGPAGRARSERSETSESPPSSPSSEEAAYLRAVAGRLAAVGVTASWLVVTDHHPGVALLDWLNHQAGTLAVLATHGRTGIPAVVLGGTAGAVVRGAIGPVVLRRPPGLARPPAADRQPD